MSEKRLWFPADLVTFFPCDGSAAVRFEDGPQVLGVAVPLEGVPGVARCPLHASAARPSCRAAARCWPCALRSLL